MMTLAKALKVKNRLAGKLAKLRVQAQGNVNRRADTTTSVDTNAVWSEMERTQAELTILKSKLAVASAPITPKLTEMAELKSEVTFYESLHIQEGTTDVVTGFGVNQTVKQVEWKPYISESVRVQKIAEIQRKIENLQDDVDEFNAVTKIEL